MNVACPVSSSNRMRPTAYTSLRTVIDEPDACSGDMYAGVPTHPTVRLVRVSIERAIPKSITFT